MLYGPNAGFYTGESPRYLGQHLIPRPKEMQVAEELQQGKMRMLGHWTTIDTSILTRAGGTYEGILGDHSFRHANFKLKPDTKLKVSQTNDEPTFDERRKRVRGRRICGKYTTTRREHAS